MKVYFYVGITALALIFAATGLANTSFFEPITAFFSNPSVLIALGITQAASILFLVKPNSPKFNTVGESTLLVSSLILLMSNQVLFVICNLVLVVSSKLVFSSQSSEKKKAVEQASAA